MAEHPIDGLMRTAMENIREMVDVNTILGDPVETPDGNVILPVSRVSFGFVAGGTEFQGSSSQEDMSKSPFGGGSGAGISLSPVAFLVVGKEQVRLLPVDRRGFYDRLIEMTPNLLSQIEGMVKNSKNGSQGSDPHTKERSHPFLGS